MDSPVRCLEVSYHFPRGDEGVIFLGLLELPYPRVFDHAEDEFPSLELRGFEGRIIAVSGLVDRLLLGADRCLIIVAYQRVVNGRLVWSGERDGVVLRVGCQVVYDPYEVMYPVSLFIRDDKEDL